MAYTAVWPSAPLHETDIGPGIPPSCMRQIFDLGSCPVAWNRHLSVCLFWLCFCIGSVFALALCCPFGCFSPCLFCFASCFPLLVPFWELFLYSTWLRVSCIWTESVGILVLTSWLSFRARSAFVTCLWQINKVNRSYNLIQTITYYRTPDFPPLQNLAPAWCHGSVGAYIDWVNTYYYPLTWPIYIVRMADMFCSKHTSIYIYTLFVGYKGIAITVTWPRYHT